MGGNIDLTSIPRGCVTGSSVEEAPLVALTSACLISIHCRIRTVLAFPSVSFRSHNNFCSKYLYFTDKVPSLTSLSADRSCSTQGWSTSLGIIGFAEFYKKFLISGKIVDIYDQSDSKWTNDIGLIQFLISGKSWTFTVGERQAHNLP